MASLHGEGGKVGARLLAVVAYELERVRAHGGLQASEGEIERVAVQQWPREREGRRVAELG